MSTYLPAPYESVSDDDLGAAAAATLVGTLGALVAVSIGRQAWDQRTRFVDLIDAGSFSGDNLAVVVSTVGWAVAAVLMVLGAVLLLFRRGLGLLVVGSVVGVVTTAIARYGYDWFTPRYPIDNLPVFLGGIGVLLLALLPATRRWVAGRRTRSRGLPPVTSATALTPTRVQFGQAR